MTTTTADQPKPPSAAVRLGVARPKITVAVALLSGIFALLFGIGGLDRLAPADDTFPGADAVEARDAIERATGLAEDPSVIAMVTVPAGASRADLDKQLKKTQTKLSSIPGVGRVQIGLDPGAPPDLISIDERRGLVLASLAGETAGLEDRSLVAERAEELLGDTKGVTLGGPAIVEREIQHVVTEDLHRAELITVPILILLALLIFRGVVAALVPVVIAGLATIATMAVLVALTFTVDVSLFALNITTALATGLGIDYGLLIVSRYREELEVQPTVRSAVLRTMATAGRAVSFSALTVAASIAALMIFPQPYLRSLGGAGALVALLCGLVAIVVTPAMLLIIGHRIDSLSPAWLKRRAHETAHLDEQGRWYRWSMYVTRHPIAFASIATALMLVLALPFLRVEFTTADVSVLPSATDARQSTTQISQYFPNTDRASATVVVRSNSAATDAQKVHATLLDVAGKRTTVLPVQPVDDKTAVIHVQLPGGALDPAAVAAVERIREVTKDSAVVGGRTARFVEQRDSVLGRTPLAGLLVVLITSFFILLLTRSVILPIKTALMNAMTLAATFGMLVWVFQDGRMEGLLGFESQGALEVAQPAIVCALVFGLSTDYGVFLLARVREAVDSGMDTRSALAFGVERTGRIITSAAILFCVALGATAMSRLVTVKQVGLGVAFAVLLDATVVRAVLVPALMQLLGKRNWWAPASLARLLERRGPVEH